MAASQIELQPGVTLHNVIKGCFATSGSSFEAWCRENKVPRSNATNATYGQSGGEVGKALLNRMIDAAGREMVVAHYKKRIREEAKALGGATA